MVAPAALAPPQSCHRRVEHLRALAKAGVHRDVPPEPRCARHGWQTTFLGCLNVFFKYGADSRQARRDLRRVLRASSVTHDHANSRRRDSSCDLAGSTGPHGSSSGRCNMGREDAQRSSIMRDRSHEHQATRARRTHT